MTEKIFCEKCRFSRYYYNNGYHCIHDVCFKDTPISPMSERKYDCGDESMNIRNSCQYFKPARNLFDIIFETIGIALWGEKK